MGGAVKIEPILRWGTSAGLNTAIS